MKLSITEQAFLTLSEQFDLHTGDEVRIFIRYGGCGHSIPGFSLGINKENLSPLATATDYHGVIFFVAENDEWYFEGNDLYIDYDIVEDEPIFEIK